MPEPQDVVLLTMAGDALPVTINTILAMGVVGAKNGVGAVAVAGGVVLAVLSYWTNPLAVRSADTLTLSILVHRVAEWVKALFHCTVMTPP